MEAPVKPYEKLWLACCMVESSNDSLALNIPEGATGIVQIRPIKLLDYNQRTGKGYHIRDCYNIKISKEIWIYYASKFRPEQQEQIAKAWNGRGLKNRIYWGKIKKHL